MAGFGCPPRAKLDQGNVSEESAKLIALELFREGTISLGRAVELCHTPLAAFMDDGITYHPYGWLKRLPT
jgi:predicted HTH domain antitoxin